MVTELNQAQVSRLSEIIGNLSLVVFAAMVLPAFINPEAAIFTTVVSGIIGTIACVIGSLSLLKGRRRK